jgi:hypothetical protein
MLDNKMRETLDQLIGRTVMSFHTVMSSIRTDKADFHIQNELDYALGLAHGMILTGFMSDFKDQYKRNPQEDLVNILFSYILGKPQETQLMKTTRTSVVLESRTFLRISHLTGVMKGFTTTALFVIAYHD